MRWQVGEVGEARLAKTEEQKKSATMQKRTDDIVERGEYNAMQRNALLLTPPSHAKTI